jgi:hypothetical protein
MTTLYNWVLDWFDRSADDICRLLERILAALMMVTGVLFTLLTFGALFG